MPAMQSIIKHAFDADALATLRNIDDGAEATTFDFKAPVRAATTTNGTLATAFEDGDVIDGVTLATGDRILLQDQTSAEENGIYTVEATGAPIRATDADADAEVNFGMTVHVTTGTANGNKVFRLTTADPITVGTTELTFVLLVSGSALVDTTFSETGIAIPALTKAVWDNNDIPYSMFGVEFDVSAAVDGNSTEQYTLMLETDSSLAFSTPVTVWSQVINYGAGVYEAILDADTIKALDPTAAYIRSSVVLQTGFAGTPSITYGARTLAAIF